MTTKKTVRVPVNSEGVPVVVEAQALDKTREVPACESGRLANATENGAAPREVVDEEVTVPVQSSIESTVTFEMLRRQSTEDDEE